MIRITGIKEVSPKGEQIVVLSSIRGVETMNSLPQEYVYTQGNPRVYADSANGDVLVHSNRLSEKLFLGKKLPKESFDAIIEEIRQAGRRLSEIRRKQREMNKDWIGEIEILI